MISQRHLAPADLLQKQSIADVVESADSSFQFAAEERFQSRQIVINDTSSSIEATGPILLPLLTGEAFPRVTVPPPVHLSRLDNAVCFGHGVIFHGDRVFTESFRSGRAIGNENVAKVKLDAEAQQIDDTCLYLDGEHAGHFGHTLAEILSRLWIIEHLDVSRLRIISGLNPRQTFIREAMEILGLSPEQFIGLDRPIRCATLLIPSQSNVVRTGFGSTGHRFYSHFAELAGRGMTSDRIYVSRRLAAGRKFINEDQAEKVFRSQGFDVVFPEMLTLRSQISLFASAKYIAGVSGSNLFGALFNRSARSKFIITGSRYILHNDACLNSGAPLAVPTYFVTQQDETHGPFSVDMNRLADSVDRWAGGF